MTSPLPGVGLPCGETGNGGAQRQSGLGKTSAARGPGANDYPGGDCAGQAEGMMGRAVLLGLGLVDVLLGLRSRRRGSLRWKRTVFIGLVVMVGAVYGLLSVR